jgi:hypothetical protein
VTSGALESLAKSAGADAVAAAAAAVAAGAVESLGASGLSPKQMFELGQAAVGGVVGGLKKAAVTDVPGATEAIAKASVGSLKVLALADDVLLDAAQGLAAGAVSGLAGAGVAKDKIGAVAGSVTGAAVTALSTAGVGKELLGRASGGLAAGAIRGLAGAGMDGAAIAGSDVLSTILAGAVGGLPGTGFPAATLGTAMSEIASHSVAALRFAGLKSGAQRRDALASLMDGSVRNAGKIGLAKKDVAAAVGAVAQNVVAALPAAEFPADEVADGSAVVTKVAIEKSGATGSADAIAIAAKVAQGVSSAAAALKEDKFIDATQLSAASSAISTGATSSFQTLATGGILSSGDALSYLSSVGQGAASGFKQAGVDQATATSLSQTVAQTLTSTQTLTQIGVSADQQATVSNSVNTATTTAATTGVVAPASTGPGQGTLAIASLSTKTIVLSHSAPQGATSVVVRRLASADCSQATPTQGTGVTVAVGQSTITDSGLGLATAYCYRAFWYGSDGIYTAQTTALPSYAGTGPGSGTLSKTSVTRTGVTLSHTPPTSSRYVGVQLIRLAQTNCTGATSGTTVSMSTSSATISDSGLTADTTYCYRIAWLDAFGNSSVAVVNAVTTAALSHPTCNLTSGHVGYYEQGTVALVFTCDVTVSAVNAASKPSFLGATVSGGNEVHFDGTAATIGTTNWSFTVNGLSTDGDASAVTTTVIDASTLTASVLASHTMATAEAGADIDLDFQLPLASAYDGTAVDLQIHNLASDIPALALACSGTSRLCAGVGSIASATFTKALALRWSFSAYDQGGYHIDFTPHAVIDGHDYTLPARKVLVDVPRQVADGNVTLATTGDASAADVDSAQKNYSLALSPASTALAPVLAVSYSNTNPSYQQTVQKVTVDRTDPPGSDATTGLTATNNLDLSSNWPRGSQIRPLSDGSWASLTALMIGSGLSYQRITTVSATPSASTAVMLNSVTDELVDLDMTDVFDDGGTNRIAYAYTNARLDPTGYCYVKIGKINPMGVDQASINDEPNFAGNGAYPTAFSSTGQYCDRPRIRYHYRDASNHFLYVAFRDYDDLKLIRMDSSYSGGYGVGTAATTSGVLADATVSSATSGGSAGTHDIAVATIAGDSTVGVVYVNTTVDSRCYFRRYNEDLSTASTPIEISSVACRAPTIHYNPASGRFIVTYVSSDYDIATSEVTVGSPDSRSTPVTVVETGQTSAAINKLATVFYPVGNWVGLVYHLASGTAVKLHGYHVSDE